jgi:hypothetical protein
MMRNELENFKVEVGVKGNISVFLNDIELVSIKRVGLFKLLSTFLSQEDLRLINGHTERNVNIDQQDIRVNELIRVYFSHKRAFYGNKKIVNSEFKRGTVQYKAFVKALELVDAHAVSYDAFMKAQIKGLAFAKVFPKPSQLCTEDAETRLLKEVAPVKAKKEVRLIRLAPDDYNLSLKQNNKFQGVYKRIMNKERVEIEELFYCRDVISARGKSVPSSVTSLIEEYEKENR